MFETIFWLSFLFIIYTYFGYPILLVIVAKLWGKSIDKRSFTPNVTMIIAAYNEERIIRDKLKNALNMDYPKDKFEIIIVSDASTDGTDEIVKEFSDQRVRLKRMPERGGKTRAINAAVPEANGEIILFSDTRQMYDKNALREIMDNFNDPKVGGVSGELYLINSDGGNVGEGVGMYWKYEKLLRKKESQIYSTSGATGAIYAIRRELYQPIPDDTILDDVVIPMNIVLKGYRVIFEEQAMAYDKVASTAKQELTRKIRTLCGNYQAYFHKPKLFNPFKNRVFFQFISHKVFRLLVPFALILMLVLNIFLLSSLTYKILLILQILLYISAVMGHFVSKRSFIGRIFGIPYTFVVLNYAALAGFYRFITKSQQVTWKKADVNP